mmetsp:Transcript_5330/g.15197  ORF Transcript_5330/g.15197 Transcript_5330/m.15197 type:complete len:411 (-) Transcript_5330:127-1359(-)
MEHPWPDRSERKIAGRLWNFMSFFTLWLSLVKYITSTMAYMLSIAFVVWCISEGQTDFSVPVAWNMCLMFASITFLFYLEGLQVGLLALFRQDLRGRERQFPGTERVFALASKGDNLQRFLLGRQFLVVFIVFLCSQVCTLHVRRPVGIPSALWWPVVKTGLPGSLVVLAFGQLTPQVLASRCPLQFCNTVGAYIALVVSLAVESAGATDFPKLLMASCWRFVFLFRPAAVHEKSLDLRSIQEGRALARIAQIVGLWGHSGVASLAELSENLFLCDEQAPCASAASVSDDVCPATSKVLHVPPDRSYPTPTGIAEYLESIGEEVPCFLLPPHHERYVPPHVAACALMGYARPERASVKNQDGHLPERSNSGAGIQQQTSQQSLRSCQDHASSGYERVPRTLSSSFGDTMV